MTKQNAGKKLNFTFKTLIKGLLNTIINYNTNLFYLLLFFIPFNLYIKYYSFNLKYIFLLYFFNFSKKYSFMFHPFFNISLLILNKY